jgi:Holliday junction resolvasome RuvABC endonuclease subunit
MSIICSVTMLSAEDKAQVEAEVRRMIAELRARPTQEKEDALGLEIATLPAQQRDYVPTVLLQILAEEARS